MHSAMNPGRDIRASSAPSVVRFSPNVPDANLARPPDLHRCDAAVVQSHLHT